MRRIHHPGKLFSVPAVLVLVALLAGCSMVPLRSMLKLSALGEDMLRVDPVKFERTD